MARTKFIASPKLHAPTYKALGDHKLSKKPGVGTLIHFMSRSFVDTAMKDLALNVDYTFGLRPQGGASAIVETGLLPSRMRYLSYMAGCPRIVRVDFPPGMDVLTIDHVLEKKMASMVIGVQDGELHKLMENFHKQYMSFKTCLEPFRKAKLLLMRNATDAWMRNTPCGEGIPETEWNDVRLAKRNSQHTHAHTTHDRHVKSTRKSKKKSGAE